jgi:hypothetical protein
MSKPSIQVDTTDAEVINELDWGDDDYAFIIGADGELKSVILPENAVFVPPKKVMKILKMFGINDIDDIDNDATLH